MAPFPDNHALSSLITNTYTTSSISFFLNGQPTLISHPNPQWTLLDYLRSRNGLRGTKLGCGEGGCGACTVVMQVGEQTNNPTTKRHIKHRSINACLFPLVGCDGKHIITIEGIGSVANPHALQERLAKMHGSQCGFCTPGIVMSLYAMVRNAFDAEAKVFRLSERDIELDGALDGNLCRCTGYKTILEAAKTFVTDDLKSIFKDEDSIASKVEAASDQEAQQVKIAIRGKSSPSSSCGRPGGCCRDGNSSSTASLDTSSENESSDKSPVSEQAVPSLSSSVSTAHEMEIASFKKSVKLPTTEEMLHAYEPGTELIYPPSLWHHDLKPLCFGDKTTCWFRPTTLAQLVDLKSTYPSAKLVSGSSEITIEQRLKDAEYPVMIYVGDIPELRGCNLPSPTATSEEWEMLTEVSFAGNTLLTEVEQLCKEAVEKLGQRGQALEALRKQLRYFGGRQIRNVATLAGGIATASPISDILPVLMAVDALITVSRLDRDANKVIFRDVPVNDFLQGYRKTVLTTDMMDGVITAVRIPLIPSSLIDREVVKAYKQAKRKEDDIAIVTCCFRVCLDESGLVEQAKLAYGGMAPTTISASKTQAALVGKKWADQSTLDEALDSLQTELALPCDVPGGMSQYRTTLSASLFLRFWHQSLQDLDPTAASTATSTANFSELEHSLSGGVRDMESVAADVKTSTRSTMGKAVPHLSSLAQTTGQAEYVDDIPPQHEELFGGLVLSTHAHAQLLSVDWAPALSMPGVVGYIDHTCLSSPENNMWGSQKADEPFFAVGKVDSHGQVIGMVMATTQLEARRAARRVKVVYEDLPAIITIDDAIAAGSFFEYCKELRKGSFALDGKMEELLQTCDRVFEGTSRIGGQEQFYLETNAALAIPKAEDGHMEVWSSTQNTMETQTFVAQVLDRPAHKINVRVKRLGGGFGGKESRSVPMACYCAIAAARLGRPVRIMLTREEDMMTTGQRHPIVAKWRVGVSHDGKLQALDGDVYNNAGYSLDMSASVMDRCLTHLDNCYETPNVWLRGHVCKTNTHSNTAYRGFGAPQGMFITESIMCAMAEGLGIDVDELRVRNLYAQGHRTPFLQTIDEDWHVPTMLEQVRRDAQYEQRKAAIDVFNADPKNRWRKRGIAMIPTKFGLSFATALFLNQASAYVQIYTDGTVLLSHGGTEMGQGLYTKMCQVAAHELGVPLQDVYTADSSTYSIANASPTAASSGADLNGMAVKVACEKLAQRLRPYREELGEGATMKQLATRAYRDRVSLIASGFWKMPRVGYVWGNYKDPKPMYYYWTQGVGVSEVELDLLTGSHQVLRTDIMMDVGNSINPGLDYGQIEGAFVQGQGLFTLEESLWNSQTGTLVTTGPGNYKIPGFGDIPREFNVSLLKHDTDGRPISWKHLRSIASSKGIGEPPLFMGSTVLFALREAVKAARRQNGAGEELPLILHSPATVETLRNAIGDELARRVEGMVKTEAGEEKTKPFFVRASGCC